MHFTRIDSARAARDGGIDAIAALDAALLAALAGLPADEATQLKRTVGDLMGEVVDRLVNPAIRAFPELAIEEDAEWTAIARERARGRSTANA
ncbi:hypothetical protein ACFFTM_07380 [Pseudoduganella plicata]|uniref:Uncharacterized protein n=1 Tax=Pseudoduganella plicata TaxID=321984 RepID=A0A4P7BJ62_9BURK|nr:hypothetical protein [Pseudoduganella plicata]QBQ38363.1 hypothetical protein E1742_20925 [Pseudoduganella plicata]GGY81522.1 hypothetical protein GCM10007388_12840 [Pseudoduganella plicata]